MRSPRRVAAAALAGIALALLVVAIATGVVATIFGGSLSFHDLVSRPEVSLVPPGATIEDRCGTDATIGIDAAPQSTTYIATFVTGESKADVENWFGAKLQALGYRRADGAIELQSVGGIGFTNGKYWIGLRLSSDTGAMDVETVWYQDSSSQEPGSC